MNENQIDYFLINNLNKKNENSESDFYRGTFTLDKINNSDEIKLKNLMFNQSFCFISNSLTRNDIRDMGHWITFYINYSYDMRRIEFGFIDSFAQQYRSYGKEIGNYIDNIRLKCSKKNITFKFSKLDSPMQSNLSEFCAAFACYSVIKLQENGIKAVSLLSKMTHLHSKKK